jgi:hypothetical protein
VAQTIDYELTKREGDALFIDAAVSQTLADASVAPPGPMGASAKITRFESTGNGSMQLDLGHVRAEL